MTDVPPLTGLLREFLASNKDVHGKPMSVRAAALKSGDLQRRQTFADIANGKHSGNISEDTVSALVRIGIPERAVRRAAGHQMATGLGPFRLPSRADRLTASQRDLIESLINAILDAAEGRTEQPVQRPDRMRAVASGSTEGRAAAAETARRVRSGEEPQK